MQNEETEMTAEGVPLRFSAFSILHSSIFLQAFVSFLCLSFSSVFLLSLEEIFTISFKHLVLLYTLLKRRTKANAAT